MLYCVVLNSHTGTHTHSMTNNLLEIIMEWPPVHFNNVIVFHCNSTEDHKVTFSFRNGSMNSCHLNVKGCSLWVNTQYTHTHMICTRTFSFIAEVIITIIRVFKVLYEKQIFSIYETIFIYSTSTCYVEVCCIWILYHTPP